ncbi:MAG: HlyD family efflux transporter periplasmic adaptor subunit, partial [Planctomycetota bacterium]
QKEIADIEGQLAEAASEARTLRDEAVEQRGVTAEDRAKAAAQLAQVKTRIAGLKRQRAVLAKQEEKLTIRATSAGQVIDWKIQDRLRSRPVRQGEVVMELADPSQGWQIELTAPEKRMGHVAREWNRLQADETGEQLRVKFYPATHPDKPFEGTIVKIDTTAEARGEEGNTVLMTVEFDEESFLKVVTEPKLGAEVQAKIYCGKASIAYAYLHDMVEAVQEQYFRFVP